MGKKEKFSEEEKIWRSFQGSPDDRRAKARLHEFEASLKSRLKELKELGKVPQDLTMMDFVRNYDFRTGEKIRYPFIFR